MGELRLSYPACMLVEKSRITREDVDILVARALHGAAGRDEVATLLAIEHGRAAKCADWDRFLVERLTRHFVDEVEPVRGMNPCKVAMIRRALARGDVVGSRNEFEVLVRIVEELGEEAAELAAFALKQIHLAVVEGEGPLANRRKGLWAALDMAHLTAINRILKALGQDEPLSLTDAEALFDPAENLLNDPEASAWGEFVAMLTRRPQRALASRHEAALRAA
jgi:hypothetical protein